MDTSPNDSSHWAPTSLPPSKDSDWAGCTQTVLSGDTHVSRRDFPDYWLLFGLGEQKNNDNDDNVTRLHNTSQKRNPAVGQAALIGFEK